MNDAFRCEIGGAKLNALRERKGANCDVIQNRNASEMCLKKVVEWISLCDCL